MHLLLRTLTLAACAVLGGMGGALAQASPVTAHAQHIQLPYNVGTGLALTATDSTPGGPYPISYTIATQPAHGEVGVGGGSESHGPNVSCQPTLGYMGQDITYTATTANGTSAPATVRIEIFER